MKLSDALLRCFNVLFAL